jgi:glutamine amidotransferase
MITIIDYGTGNLGSVRNMIRKVGGTSVIASDAASIASAEKLILPGVGAFDYGMQQLARLDLVRAIQDKAASGTPVLGICLGMQLLASRSEEGDVPGLGLVDAQIRRFAFPPDAPLAIPHVGWNELAVVRDNPLVSAADGTTRFYFTHSFHAVCDHPEDELATTRYGYPFTAVYGRGNVFGVQFHPEKSHRFGMHLMRQFVGL